ncbi:hypothetical protein B0H13DRAFT_2489446 [Mycena leptocephala]|nr:hypothetical protein B0H13DRAFT_2489446 [Mycena leptocephala]
MFSRISPSIRNSCFDARFRGTPFAKDDVALAKWVKAPITALRGTYRTRGGLERNPVDQNMEKDKIHYDIYGMCKECPRWDEIPSKRSSHTARTARGSDNCRPREHVWVCERRDRPTRPHMISATKSSDTARSTDAFEFRAAGKGRVCKTKGDREVEEGEDADSGVVRCGRAKVKRGGDAPVDGIAQACSAEHRSTKTETLVRGSYGSGVRENKERTTRVGPSRGYCRAHVSHPHKQAAPRRKIDVRGALLAESAKGDGGSTCATQHAKTKVPLRSVHACTHVVLAGDTKMASKEGRKGSEKERDKGEQWRATSDERRAAATEEAWQALAVRGGDNERAVASAAISVEGVAILGQTNASREATGHDVGEWPEGTFLNIMSAGDGRKQEEIELYQ